MACSPQGSSVYEILQARILGWVAISFRGSSSDLISSDLIFPVIWFETWGSSQCLLHWQVHWSRSQTPQKKSPENFHLQRCVLGNVKAPRCWQESHVYLRSEEMWGERSYWGPVAAREGQPDRGGDCGKPQPLPRLQWNREGVNIPAFLWAFFSLTRASHCPHPARSQGAWKPGMCSLSGSESQDTGQGKRRVCGERGQMEKN